MKNKIQVILFTCLMAVVLFGIVLPYTALVAFAQPSATPSATCEPRTLAEFHNIISEAPEFSSFAVAGVARPGMAALVCLIWIIIELALQMGIVIGAIMIIISGYQYMLAGGEEKAVTGAKGRLTYAIIGFIIVILAIPIINFVFGFVFKAGGGSSGTTFKQIQLK